MSRVNADISDLFFNYEPAVKAAVYSAEPREQFIAMEAVSFLGSLERLGVGGLPTADELAQDFLDRE